MLEQDVFGGNGGIGLKRENPMAVIGLGLAQRYLR